MRCPACDYRNPGGSPVCVECGVELEWTAHRDAEDLFSRQLETTVRRARERYRRANRYHDGGSSDS